VFSKSSVSASLTAKIGAFAFALAFFSSAETENVQVL